MSRCVTQSLHMRSDYQHLKPTEWSLPPGKLQLSHSKLEALCGDMIYLIDENSSFVYACLWKQKSITFTLTSAGPWLSLHLQAIEHRAKDRLLLELELAEFPYAVIYQQAALQSRAGPHSNLSNSIRGNASGQAPIDNNSLIILQARKALIYLFLY